MSKIINYTRLTTSDRFSDRFLTCQVYQPVDPEQAQDGMIFSQIEIGNPWFPTAQIGQTVINTLIREYYRGSNSSDLINFESAIKKVNESLAQIAQGGETDWIGKFNGILALVIDTEIHFAQTGLCEAYLYRADKINQITEGLNNDEPPHPLKTFSNLTSGTIQEGDKIVIGNADFFDVIPAPELKTLITSFRPALAAVECAKILKGRNVQTANAIFIELTTKEELANVPPDQKVDAIYIDQPMYSVGASLRSFWSGIIAPAGRTTGRVLALGGKKTADFLSPRIKEGLERTKKHTGNAAQAIMSAGKNVKRETSGESRKNAPDNIQPRKYFLKIKNRFKRMLIGLGLYSSNKSKMYLVPLIVVILVLAITVGYSLYAKNKRQEGKAIDTTFAQITSLESQASQASEKRDENSALQSYKNIVALSDKLKGTKYESKVNPLKQNALDKIAQISKISAVSAMQNVDLKQETNNIVFAGGSIFSFAKSGEVLEINPSSPKFSSLSKINLSAKVQSASQINEEKIALVLENNELGVFDIAGKAYAIQKADLEYAGRIEFYGDNIYELAPPLNKIIKISANDGIFKEISQYIKDENADVSGGVDMAIDGSVYVLLADGKITRFSRGTVKSEINIELPFKEKLTDFKNIFTSESSGSIFIANAGKNNVRIIELKKSGEFSAQFELSESQNAQDIAVDLGDRLIYVLKENKVSLFKI